MGDKGELVYEVIFMGDTVMRVSLDGNLHPSEVQDCLSVLSDAFMSAQRRGDSWHPDVHEEPWMGPGGEVDSIKVVRVNGDDADDNDPDA